MSSGWEQTLRDAFVFPAPPTDDRFAVLLKRLEAAMRPPSDVTGEAVRVGPFPPPSPLVAPCDRSSVALRFASDTEATPEPVDKFP